MKGGRTAPRSLRNLTRCPRQTQRFNEGGADCPPKHSDETGLSSLFGASMKGGRTAPRSCQRSFSTDKEHWASMKGGRTAPRS